MSIFEYNGSALVAMVGKNCFAIASDRRLGVQLQTIATDFERIYKIHDKLFIGLSGLASDAQTLYQRLAFRHKLYQLREERDMKPETFASLVSAVLYEKRFGPYFCQPVIAGLGDKDKPFICTMDSIGAKELAKDFVVAGTASESLYGACEAMFKPDMEAEELFETISQALISSVDRDCLSGWGGHVYVVISLTMPASSSEARTRWKKRRRGEPLISRKSKAPQHSQDDDVMEDDDDDEEEFNDDATDGNANSLPAPDRAVHVKESELVYQGGEQISSFPLVVKQRVIRPPSSVVSVAAMELSSQLGDSLGIGQNTLLLENISYGQLQVSSAVPADTLPSGPGEDSGSASVVISPPPIMKGSGVVKRFGSAARIHVLPMHSDWFSPYTVHRLERQVVPHFFSGKSPEHVPEKYMECRNCIVAKYMENPDKYLSLDDCLGLVTDVSHDDLARIVRFLDHWGIINYCAAPLNFDPRKETTILCEDSNGDLCVPTATLKSIDSLIKFDKPKCKLKAADIYPDLARSAEDPDFDNLIREKISESRCNYCSHPTPAVYYQSQKEVDVLLCSDCYHDGRFVVGHSSLDFVKVNSLRGYTGLEGESWTDEETLLLLEGMQRYNENWNKVAEHVGIKSKSQCILHFVRFPLDGSSLENVEVPSSGIQPYLQNGDDHGISHSKANGNSTGFKGQDSDFKSEFPFASCGNPVMALVAFLASAVGPRVAAACAHASLDALSKDDVSTSSQTPVQKDGSRLSTEGLNVQDGGPLGDHANSNQQKDEKLRGQGPWNPNELEATPLSSEQVMAAAKVGLGAAATKSKLSADHEERETVCKHHKPPAEKIRAETEAVCRSGDIVNERMRANGEGTAEDCCRAKPHVIPSWIFCWLP